MKSIEAVNEFVIRFANVNGTGSASANAMFAKSIFRMGIPVSPKNIFPSNIQGLPTWYEVRVSEKNYLGRRGGVDIAVAINPQSMAQDIGDLNPGGFFIYDNTKALDLRLHRDDVNLIGLPLTDICRREYSQARQRQLFKNVIYVGALAALLDIDFAVLKDLVGAQFKGKDKLIASNIHALELGYQYAQEKFSCPLSIHLERRDLIGDRVMLEGNDALALGAVYGGATVVPWYPLTPSTSVIEGFEKYAKRLRIDPGSGDRRFCVAQAEDELAAIGMVIGASWNGARAFTATSGPGLSLMAEFLGLAYFAEVPTVLFDIQRAGPSTGMPTRTQQSDIFAAAYASHGDSKHVLLIPADPKECFEMAADSFDIAERLQTPVILMSDLDLGMNDSLSAPLEWDDTREYDRGKVLSAEDLENMTERYGRYLDVDGDGICYRTLPGTHPEKGAFFTRGTSRNEYAVYTEFGDAYVKNMERLNAKMETAKRYVPAPVLYKAKKKTRDGVIFYGTSTDASLEALDLLADEGLHLDALRLRAFPFNKDVTDFIDNHDRVFVIEQNRDAQMRKLLIIECDLNPKKLLSYIHYDGMPMTALGVSGHIAEILGKNNVTPLRKRKAGA
ncbi:MAG: 2-oxoacid:acceptor oxidoreductase subunit alpha [Gammaproteobacteria bacterium]|nr:2-oxoacid:acceptor oxidoreductase subunit alpha [Gammaproteobacteria bacterium]MBQ0838574.1 2-oxoacid:acceptor oxidoreductase subunit alpha [Gammaproteobacteria bacterium]